MVKALQPNSADSLKQELAAIAENQEALLKHIETFNIYKPSQQLIDFFKAFKVDISNNSNILIESQLRSLEDDFEDEDYIKNLKRIPRSGNAKLKAKLKRYKSILTKDFTEKAKTLDYGLKDATIALSLLSEVKSLTSEIRFYEPKVNPDTNTDS